MQPTKLPDEFFQADDWEWQRADYQARIALLVKRFENGRAMNADLLRQLAAAVTDREMLCAELRNVRDVNAQLRLGIYEMSERNVALALEIQDSHRLLAEVAAVTKKK